MAWKRQLPRLTDVNRDFWTGGSANELRIYQCRECECFIHPPQPVCRRCLSDDVGPKVVSGLGVIDSFTVNYKAWMPEMDVPFVVARIALDDAPGVFVTSNLVDCGVDDIEFGEHVKVRFLQQDDVWLPLFEKVT